jgi:CubicO group peptidase (beta-lactamase class C family)
MRLPFALPALVLAALLLWGAPLRAQTTGTGAGDGAAAPHGPGPVEVENALDGLDDFMAQALAEWKVPGAAVAVVKNGRTIYAKGFGLRDAEARLPVTPDTVFPIGSCTKAFTAAALRLLADAGDLNLDAPVRDILPAFRMYDDYATAHVTTRDMLLHRTGLPRYDALILMRPDMARDEIVQALRFLPPNKELRAGFEYSNIMYAAAGRLVEVVSGKSWEDFVAERIFAPLSMASAGFAAPAADGGADAAAPYALRRGRLTRIADRNIAAFGPAGSIRASASDMARWLAVHLEDGRADGRTILSAQAIADMHAPQIITPRGAPNPVIPFGGYGLGWGVTAYRGHLLVLHDGEIDGFKALASIMPDDELGVAVLTNRAGTPLPEIAAFQIYDRLLGLSPFPWAERAMAERAKAAKARAEARPAAPEAKAPPTHELSAYAGTYRHPAFGDISVSVQNGALAAACGGQTIPLVHVAYDVFRMVPGEPDAGAGGEDDDAPLQEQPAATFRMDLSGDIASLDIPLDPHAGDIIFTRTAAPAAGPGRTGPHSEAPQGATRP